MNKEEIPVITDIEELYDKCENMEQLYDKYYLPLLIIHYRKTYELQQENQELKKQVDYLRRSVERKEETIIDLQNERVPYTNEYVAKLENQQKEFISYLENEKDRLARECSQIYEDSLGKTRLVNEDIFNEVNKNLAKYKEIIGGKE